MKTNIMTKSLLALILTLFALINSVEAQRGNKISDDDADLLVFLAQAIIGSIE